MKKLSRALGLGVLIAASALAYQPQPAAAGGAEFLKIQFMEDGYMCWNIRCNVMKGLCCAVYRQERQ